MVILSKNYVDNRISPIKQMKVIRTIQEPDLYKNQSIILPLLIKDTENLNSINGEIVITSKNNHYERHKIILGGYGTNYQQVFVETLLQSVERRGQGLITYEKTNGEHWWGWKIPYNETGFTEIKFIGEYTFNDMLLDDFLIPTIYLPSGKYKIKNGDSYIYTPETETGEVGLSTNSTDEGVVYNLNYQDDGTYIIQTGRENLTDCNIHLREELIDLGYGSKFYMSLSETEGSQFFIEKIGDKYSFSCKRILNHSDENYVYTTYISATGGLTNSVWSHNECLWYLDKIETEPVIPDSGIILNTITRNMSIGTESSGYLNNWGDTITYYNNFDQAKTEIQKRIDDNMFSSGGVTYHPSRGYDVRTGTTISGENPNNESSWVIRQTNPNSNRTKIFGNVGITTNRMRASNVDFNRKDKYDNTLSQNNFWNGTNRVKIWPMKDNTHFSPVYGTSWPPGISFNTNKVKIQNNEYGKDITETTDITNLKSDVEFIIDSKINDIDLLLKDVESLVKTQNEKINNLISMLK